MDTNNTRTLVKFAALVTVLAALVLMEEPTSIPACNINANHLEKCHPAITGDNPPSPRKECCEVLQAANLECICRFKSFLPVLAVYPSKVQALLSKCGVTTIPPACQALKN
ncbi:Bifunctional inhibitor/plant lipid transfer protein/seed storage helical domain superfamily [Arabidopsis suecica]|uniref:Bifunctional inhibitor/plant lipid transfer protein/seed storage helical domain superfamily n=1 Tax=Arabidopsis suecica TaxID=45249 RepID=A0A8T1XTJ4_ARASU|nr:Bifunctional inhibitor/plant lipid transfer protein/seed storage helical domain superfamily [Arabidopsis suecica]